MGVFAVVAACSFGGLSTMATAPEASVYAQVPAPHARLGRVTGTTPIALAANIDHRVRSASSSRIGPLQFPRLERFARSAPRKLATARNPKTPCVYAKHDQAKLRKFGQLVGRDFACALVYNNAAPSWSDWESPWFVKHGNPDFNWANWHNARPGRQLVISQALIPSSVPTNWRGRGASGAFDAHARALASNLISAGLGRSIIRLAFEANGPWMIDSIGKTPADRVAWRAYWRRFVLAMRSMPGAHFEFDWTVNAGYRPIPFDDYYPGDDVVDIVGIDAYDSSVSHAAIANATARWRALFNQPSGLGALLAFARQHHKPLSLPEWGLTAPGAPMFGAGDDPTYLDGIAMIVRTNVVRYQCYFLSATGGVGMTLESAPESLAAYRRHFGIHGDSAPR